jgi:hypothetical protein
MCFHIIKTDFKQVNVEHKVHRFFGSVLLVFCTFFGSQNATWCNASQFMTVAQFVTKLKGRLEHAVFGPVRGPDIRY